ncbi:MAG: aspartyl/asparaginyl beta-hydroxylase (cupin superfamily) [Verrucomicrobiales bacterium]|jgi:aspartyl/asparaginyl beta-hydroxylase (cupin superfamily)
MGSTQRDGYAARLEVDYPEELNRVKTVFRLILVIPIAVIAAWFAIILTNKYPRPHEEIRLRGEH